MTDASDEYFAGTERLSVGAVRRRVGDPRPGCRLHQVAAVSACPVDSYFDLKKSSWR